MLKLAICSNLYSSFGFKAVPRAGFDASRIDKAAGLEKEQVPCSAGETPAIQYFTRHRSSFPPLKFNVPVS